MLRICARNLYGWQCDHENLLVTNTALDSWTDWNSYPESWPELVNNVNPLWPLLRPAHHVRVSGGCLPSEYLAFAAA
jgi:hypothetical protein